MKIAVIGGGAAGFFAAISARSNYPNAEVVIFEKSQKLLAKVKVSGGGRCNVTNGCRSISELCKAYPRGGRSLKKAFHRFNTEHTWEWFESRGVALKTEPDGRVFPQSNDSQSIIDCLMTEINRLGIRIKLGTGITAIEPDGDQLLLTLSGSSLPNAYDKVIIATGGSPKLAGFDWLKELGHHIEPPVPSLFTFNMPKHPITQLMGVVASNAGVSIQGTKLKSEGPLLVTHWGMSGPAILKLSAFGARTLSDFNYEFKAQVNWINERNTENVVQQLQEAAQEHPQKLLTNQRPFGLPERLWLYLLEKSELSPSKKWNELGKKGANKLTSLLTNDEYPVRGKTTFKEEFVTCGGVSLNDVDMNTMQSKVCKNLYFAGEVLDIDAITGGYNFQAAWTTGFVAGHLK